MGPLGPTSPTSPYRARPLTGRANKDDNDSTAASAAVLFLLRSKGIASKPDTLDVGSKVDNTIDNYEARSIHRKGAGSDPRCPAPGDRRRLANPRRGAHPRRAPRRS